MRMLIVEDETQVRDFLKISFEAECFAVDATGNGADGLRLALINEYDLLILDYMLPNHTGLEICRDLRAKGRTTPVLILSVNSETDIKTQVINAGADDYLTKPFSFTELHARVRALLRRSHVMTGPVYTAHDITLNSQSHTVTKGDTAIALTRKEFMLLECLMRHRGTVLSRGMLIENVWDMNADPFSNTIESHILSLRKKLNINVSKDIIKTVTGYGYKIE
ncbi:DNA-binding response regulator [Candidatus Kaiserbacteria bacterium RIFCSPLOWO2_02_FULL_45_11b]|uniref:DNA-binding response regulator n=1 Tax=Candidatus Kaiserbacteria bacterium RIFCSPLOWO2_12_FULL_45_26 TaxID=1798525 RepID=A0A1F6FGF9_9BACT|nr:MAG: DNA-binding response regulator [Candidatus Kaiserbacteria bacterium RIFCSPHIGHO2_12_45_16]OGG71015.1 MAG: DNA-binding response regulator [Candidatus Kaiserbacteria bacterium RIFCSPLOWO2_01_FULL_45_25]OGG84206.1 MAG: DNA-binding response regulator [Candidatus Kaiserbacteria bacterium RIFCSPLOWO2_02_FULL_45_11b]OGG84941.1 MAG: DNA-binding response regulator [Candidatus Kaiserbacteria bacterium RIFCSPLOWO2_12_FULL_45_26]